MTGARTLLVEGGVTFLLFFTPLAFGGVEPWALGVVQLVAVGVLAAWAWSPETDPEAVAVGASGRRRLPLFWVPAAAFMLLVGLQLLPLGPGWIEKLSPGAHRLYAATLPGYAEGRRFAAPHLVPWLVEDQRPHLPGAMSAEDAAWMALADPERAGASPAQAAGGAGTGTPAAPPTRTLSIAPGETWQRLRLLLALAALLAAVAGYYRTRARLARLVLTAVLAGFAVSLLGILQKLSGTGRLFGLRETVHTDLFGPFINRNSYAAFAGTLFPLALCLALAALARLREGREGREGQEGRLARFLLLTLATVVLGGGVFYSLSRGGMLAVGLSVVVVAGLLTYHGRRGVELVVLGALLALAVGFVAWVGPDEVAARVGTLAEGTSTPTFAARVEAWERSLQLLAAYPVLGAGLGTFRFAFMEHAPPGRAWWTTAHNEYLEVVCDTGLVGGLLALAAAALLASAVLRPWAIGGRTTPFLHTGLVAGVAGLLLHAGVSSVLQVPANGVLLVVLAGGLLGLVERQDLRPAGGRARRRRGAA